MEAPGWFNRAIAAPKESRSVTVDGARIHYLRWGDGGQPGIVLVHGGAANAYWWAHLAPRLRGEDDYTVVAIDMSGHGDSGHRDEYEATIWCKEVIAVAKDAGITEPPVVIGHSMGGFVSLATAAYYPDAIAGVIIVDSPVRELTPEELAARKSMDFSDPKVYPDLETAVSRFRTVPAQKNYEPYIMDFVARHSLKPVGDDGEVTWKFDPRVFAQRRTGGATELLAKVHGRVALLRSQYGLITPDIGRFMYDNLGRVAPVIELPQAGHHPMLDVPLTLLTALRTLLADWEHSTHFERKT